MYLRVYLRVHDKSALIQIREVTTALTVAMQNFLVVPTSLSYGVALSRDMASAVAFVHRMH